MKVSRREFVTRSAAVSCNAVFPVRSKVTAGASLSFSGRGRSAAPFFRPSLGKMWDTFILYNEGTYYLYYLYNPDETYDEIDINRPHDLTPQEAVSFFETCIRLAISHDGVHWADLGNIERARSSTLGAANIWKSRKTDNAPAPFLMSFID